MNLQIIFMTENYESFLSSIFYSNMAEQEDEGSQCFWNKILLIRSEYPTRKSYTFGTLNF